MNNSLDDRQALIAGSRLSYNGTEYVIGEELGRGGSCIVYSANRTSANCIPQTVRIKECYPAYLGIIRCADGSLSVPPESEAAFRYYIGRFDRVFSINQELRNMQGTTNSTIDSSEMFSSNGTEYIVMRCVEGEDYSSSLDDSANSVILRALALAKILKKYHENGLLHLDVKPENMFIIPETKEHIVLFDLDSIVSLDELRSGRPCVSYSEDYAAPEVKGQQYKDINICSDFYSVGALVYMKLFGRVPHALSLHEPVEVADIGFPDERYQPVFFRKLSAFFQKTLAVSPRVRFKSDDELIESLEELRKLSDLNGVQIISNFGYDSANFVGRKNELKRIDEVFGTNHVVFLSGIGGIGKTEIAKKYASINSNMLNRILFCHFSGSIESTINTEIQITCCEPESGEDSRKYYVRKLRALQWLLTEQDMIILDNFDVSSDEDLDELLKCRCKFIITTREDYSDYNYEQINVDCFNDINDALSLFTAYNGHSYAAQEQDCIVEMIELLERHTMTVEMTAKYLDDSDVLPSEFIKELRTNEGITSANEIEVDQRKDGKRRSMIINDHLLMLFNMTGFSNEEKELIGSLALMGGIAVSRKTFLEKFCAFPGNKSAMQKLIKTGWVRFEGAAGKIALHQVIMDLVYNNLHPDADSCPHIVEAMGKYAMERTSTTDFVRFKVLSGFNTRIPHIGNQYARFSLRLFYFMQHNSICCADDDQFEELLGSAIDCSDGTKYGSKIKKSALKHILLSYPMKSRGLYEYYRSHAIELIHTYLDITLQYCRKSIYVRNAIELAFAVDKLNWTNDGLSEIGNEVLSYTVQLLEDVYIIIKTDDSIPAERKVKYLLRMIDFYLLRDKNFPWAEARQSYRFIANFMNKKMAIRCAWLSNKLVKSSDMDLSVKAFYYYALYATSVYVVNADSIYYYRVLSVAYPRINAILFLTELFFKSNDYKRALLFSRKAVKTVNAENVSYWERMRSFLFLAYAYAGVNNLPDAVSASMILINEIEMNMADISNDVFEVTVCQIHQIKAYYLLYLTLENASMKEEYRNKAFTIFEEHQNGILDCLIHFCIYDDVIGYFLIDYYKNKFGGRESIIYCYDLISKMGVCENALSDYIIKHSNEYGIPHYSFMMCMDLGEFFNMNNSRNTTGFLKINSDNEWFRRGIDILDNCEFDVSIVNTILEKYRYLDYNVLSHFEKYFLDKEKSWQIKLKCTLSFLNEMIYHNTDIGDHNITTYLSLCTLIKNNINNHDCQKIFDPDFSQHLEYYVSYLYENGQKDTAFIYLKDGLRLIRDFYEGSGYVSEQDKDDRYFAFVQTINSISLYSDQVHYIPILVVCCVVLLTSSCSDELIDAIDNSHKLYMLFSEAIDQVQLDKINYEEVAKIYGMYKSSMSIEIIPDTSRFDLLFQKLFLRLAPNDIEFK